VSVITPTPTSAPTTDDDRARALHGTPCPLCQAPLSFRGLLALDYGRNEGEAWRLNCATGHTILLDYTWEVDDGYAIADEDGDDRETVDDDDNAPHPNA
jgi:hypothetical protein